MSDYEINLEVAYRLFHTAEALYMSPIGDSLIYVNDLDNHVDSEFDYCNNPADAWPIILENNITLLFNDMGDCEVSFDYRRTDTDEVLTSWLNVEKDKKDKVLRAAMICFLKLKDKQDDNNSI